MTPIFRLLSHRRMLLFQGSCALLSFVSLGLAGCGSMAVSATEAQMRFVDTSADAPALDVYLNGRGQAYNLDFGSFSSYVPVDAGNAQLTANRASTAQALTAGKAALLSGHRYTAVVANRLGELQEHVYTDAPAQVMAGAMAVRVLNEVEGGPVDVYLVTNPGALATATPAVSNLGYALSGGYLRVPAGSSYAVYVAPAGSSPLASGVLKVNGASVGGGSGAVRTLVLSEAGTIAGKGLYGVVLEDSETP